MITALIRLFVVFLFVLLALLTHIAIARQMFIDDGIPGLEYKPECCPCPEPYTEEEEPSYG